MECCALAVRFCLHRIHASSLLALALMAALQLWSHWSTFCLRLVPSRGCQSGRSWSATVPCIRRCDIAALFLCDRHMMCSMMLMSGAAARGIITQLAQKVYAVSLRLCDGSVGAGTPGALQEHRVKWEYALSLVDVDPFALPRTVSAEMEQARCSVSGLPPSLPPWLFVFVQALVWQSERNAETVKLVRTEMVSALEEADRLMRVNGVCEAWLNGCDPEIKAVCGTINGQLFSALLEATRFRDARCVDTLRKGAQLLEELESSGHGVPVPGGVAKSSAALKQSCAGSNRKLLASLRECDGSDKLLELTREDARLGRMTPPVLVAEADIGNTLLHPRFLLEQGKPGGRKKWRAIDHLSWASCLDAEVLAHGCSKKVAQKACSVNGHTQPCEKLSYDTVDDLAAALARFVELFGCLPHLWKADIDAAFRRVPVAPEHRWACGVAFVAGGETYVSRHSATPFGAVGSVHAWERIGAALAHLARVYLKLAGLRYVDDFFGPERAETAEHGLQCFARLVRVLLGADAVAEGKLVAGPALCVLGIDHEMSAKGYRYKPAAEKVAKWIALIEEALTADCLMPGVASKLAGKLSWGCSFLFWRFGRAMLRPLFDQKSRRDGCIDPELRRALEWWLRVLRADLAELRPWSMPSTRPVHLFCDASGKGRHLGAVLFHDGEVYWSHMQAPKHVLKYFAVRGDRQIMGLELLAVSFALSTFVQHLRGRKVIVHCDNTGSEHAMRKGSAVSWDHAQLVHAQWYHAAVARIHIFIMRVSTDVNIADMPSRLVTVLVQLHGPGSPLLRVVGQERKERDFLRRVGATEVPPVLHDAYVRCSTPLCVLLHACAPSCFLQARGMAGAGRALAAVVHIQSDQARSA